VACIHLIREIHVWYPDSMINIKIEWRVAYLIASKFPNYYHHGMGSWSVYNNKLYLGVIAFAYFIPTDVSLSLGLTTLALTLFSYFMWSLGISYSGYHHLSSLTGAYIGMEPSKEGKEEYVWATSWGVSTRLIGAIIMTHGDDKGVIMPPRLAPIQVIIIPITKGEEERNKILEYIEQMTISWNGKFSFKVDDRDGYRPGWKFNEWEQQGVPLRLEIGPRDFEKNQVIMARRDNGEKTRYDIQGKRG
jgi:hypothetical protein